MKIKCPQCHRRFKVPDYYVGRHAKCQCGNSFLVGPIQAPAKIAERKCEIVPVKQDPVAPPPVLLGRSAKKNGRHYAISKYGVFLVFLAVISFFVGYRYGIKKGFGRGYDFATDLIKIPFSFPLASRNKNKEECVPATTTNVSYKITEKNQIYWAVSWKVEFYSWVDEKVRIKILFYDSDNFVIGTTSLYDKAVYKNKPYAFAAIEIFSPDVAQKINSCEAEIKIE